MGRDEIRNHKEELGVVIKSYAIEIPRALQREEKENVLSHTETKIRRWQRKAHRRGIQHIRIQKGGT